MTNAFWSLLKEQLSSTPPELTCALELLKGIKESHLRNEIEETLDMDVLKQEAEDGALDVPHLSHFILNLIILLCAPARKQTIQKLKSITDPVHLLRGILPVLGQMKMDMVNYIIQSLRPYLQECSIKYEQDKFQELLNKQPNFFDNTTKWLTKALSDLTTPPPRFSDLPSSSNMASSPSKSEVNRLTLPSAKMVLCQGYLNLLFWDSINEAFPETLLLDRNRLKDMVSQLNRLTIMASVLLVARTFSGNVLFSLPKFVDKLKCITEALTDEFNSRPEETMLRVSEQISQKIHQGLKDMGLATLSSDNTASLIGQLQNIAKKENRIRNIIDRRIHMFLNWCLISGMQDPLLDFPAGLVLIKQKLTELGIKFVNLMGLNSEIFGPCYADILNNIMAAARGTEM
ncbi:T-complex protein 11-like X-linked protein 2 [Rhynchocyon petersi]